MPKIKLPDPGQMRDRVTITLESELGRDEDGYPVVKQLVLCEHRAAQWVDNYGFDTSRRNEGRHVRQANVILRTVDGIHEMCKMTREQTNEVWDVVGMIPMPGWIICQVERVVGR